MTKILFSSMAMAVSLLSSSAFAEITHIHRGCIIEPAPGNMPFWVKVDDNCQFESGSEKREKHSPDTSSPPDAEEPEKEQPPKNPPKNPPKDDGDNGHGNDDDGHDESNPGKGDGKGPKKPKKTHSDRDKDL